MTVEERIKYLRKNILKITQEEFSSKIKISRSNLGSIETGRVYATDRVISDICESFSVNEFWLRNGGNEENIFVTPDEDIEVSKYTQELLSNTDDSISKLIKNFIIVYEKLDTDSKKILQNVAEGILDRMHGNQSDSSHAIPKTKSFPKKDLSNLTIDEMVEDYRKQLEAEEKAKAESSALQKNA